MPHFHDTQGQFLDAEVDALQSPHIKNYAKSDALASLIEELKLSDSEGEDAQKNSWNSSLDDYANKAQTHVTGIRQVSGGSSAQKNEQAKLDIITIASEISADY
jgi:hypothetical protein